MLRARRSLIVRKAEELLREAARQQPVDVDAIARVLEADVRRRPLDSGLSGLMRRRGQQVVIGINNRGHSPERQRFTLAHELGHWLLNHGDTVVDTVERRDELSAQGTNINEIEANAFASELLMPRNWLREEVPPRMLSPLDEDVIRRLASKYRVSREAMTFRLINLGLMEA